MEIGIYGLGRMGGNMAVRLAQVLPHAVDALTPNGKVPGAQSP